MKYYILTSFSCILEKKAKVAFSIFSESGDLMLTKKQTFSLLFYSKHRQLEFYALEMAIEKISKCSKFVLELDKFCYITQDALYDAFLRDLKVKNRKSMTWQEKRLSSIIEESKVNIHPKFLDGSSNTENAFIKEMESFTDKLVEV